MFAQSITKGNIRVPFDVNVSHAKKIWLIVQDTGSYSPEKMEAVWDAAELVSARGVTALSSLEPLSDAGLRGTGSVAVEVKTPSVLVYDVSGQGFTRLRGTVGIANKDVTFDLNPSVRFLVFEEEPEFQLIY